jgi:hypothetical protein
MFLLFIIVAGGFFAGWFLFLGIIFFGLWIILKLIAGVCWVVLHLIEGQVKVEEEEPSFDIVVNIVDEPEPPPMYDITPRVRRIR